MQLAGYHHVKFFPMPHVHVHVENIQVVDQINVVTVVLLCVTTDASYIPIASKMLQVHYHIYINCNINIYIYPIL